MKHILFISILTCFAFSLQYAKAQSSTSEASLQVKLNHVAIHVKDLRESGDFYKNVLKLKEIPEPFRDGKHIWYQIGPSSHLHLIQKNEEEVVVPGKTSHLCFSVQSVDDFIENLQKHNIEYTNWPGTEKAPTVRTDGVKQIYFQDPNGYWIEVNDDF